MTDPLNCTKQVVQQAKSSWDGNSLEPGIALALSGGFHVMLSTRAR
jgi:hypothetical protein